LQKHKIEQFRGVIILDCTDFNITIVGLGLIGGSFAMALKELKPRNLWAIDIDKEVLETAEKMNIIDKGYTNPEIPLNNSDIVILAVYPQKTINFVKNNMNLFKSGSSYYRHRWNKEQFIERNYACASGRFRFHWWTPNGWKRRIRAQGCN